MPRSGHAPARTRSAAPAKARAARTPAKRRAAGDPPPTPPVAPVTLSYGVRRYAVEATDVLETEIVRVVPLGDPVHYRMIATGNMISGQSEFCGLADGLFVHMSDTDYAAPDTMVLTAPNMLRVRVASESCVRYAARQGDQFEMNGPGAAIIIEPAGMPPAEATFDRRNKAVHVYMHRSNLKRAYAGREHELPAVIQDFVAGELDRTVARSVPLSPSLLRCLEDLRNDEIQGHARRLLFASKAMEILCHAFLALAREENERTLTDASAMTARCVLKAQKLLADNFVTPPSLDELAHQVGLSRSGLCAGFRQIVGQTVYDYIAELRMRQALALLNQRDASITQIAYAVGYSHPSSFSLAVQRRYGATPSELRRRGFTAI